MKLGTFLATTTLAGALVLGISYNNGYLGFRNNTERLRAEQTAKTAREFVSNYGGYQQLQKEGKTEEAGQKLKETFQLQWEFLGEFSQLDELAKREGKDYTQLLDQYEAQAVQKAYELNYSSSAEIAGGLLK